MTDSACSANQKLGILGNPAEMAKNGWTFNLINWGKNMPHDVPGMETVCGTQTNWYGWSAYNSSIKVGTLSAILKGNGKVTIDFGNCWNSGVVRVYLDSQLMAQAAINTNSVIKTFSYRHGSKLEIKDEGANSVIRLNSIKFECSGKM